jgi:hypothetical protein
MATRWPVLVELDCPEPRVALDRICLSCDGTSWQTSLADGIWVDPITRTAMLTPLPLTEDWNSVFTGDFSRLVKSDYSLADTADWNEVPRRGAADVYLEGGENAKATTVDTYSANQPFSISFYVPGVEELGERTVFKCGWGVENAAGSITLRFRANGSVTIYKGESLVGIYDSVTNPNTAGRQSKKSSDLSIAQRTVNVLLIPCRRRELLVVTDASTGFSHVFADLDPFLETETITPAGSFWWQFPATWASCQLAPLRFLEEGVIYGQLTTLRYPPPTGTLFDGIFAYDKIGVGVLESGNVDPVKADLTAYTANGVIDQLRIELSLTGDGTSTYGVYALDLYTAPTLTATADAPYDITLKVRSLSMAVPENGPVTGRLTAFNPAGLTADGLEQSDVTGDRPFRVAVGGVDILRGTTGKPTRAYSNGNDTGIADLLTWELFDREREFREKQFAAALPYDGLFLVDAVGDLVTLAGFPDTDVLISSDPFTLPYTPAVSSGKFELVPERGQTIAEWLDRFHSTFCPTWPRGWVPTLAGYKYQFFDPDDLSLTPVIALYQSHADALAGGISGALGPYRVIRNLSVERQTPEANQVIVIGQDPGTLKYIYAQYDDAASQAPATAPGSRPTNWRGRVASVVIEDPAITSQDAADRALNILVDRLVSERVVGTWESDLLIHSGSDRPLWKGDTIRLANVGGSGYTDWQIIAIPNIEFVWESQVAGEFQIRNCTYMGRRVGSGGGDPDIEE